MGSAMECLSRGSLVKDNSIIDPKDVGSNTRARNGEGKNIIGIDHVFDESMVLVRGKPASSKHAPGTTVSCKIVKSYSTCRYKNI